MFPFLFFYSLLSLSLSPSVSVPLALFPYLPSPLLFFSFLDSRFNADRLTIKTTYDKHIHDASSQWKNCSLLGLSHCFLVTFPSSSHLRYILMLVWPPPISCYCVSYYRLPYWNAYLSITSLATVVEKTLPEAEKTEWVSHVWMKTIEQFIKTRG